MQEKVKYNSSTEIRPKRHIGWAMSTPFFLVHVVALVAPFYVPFSWSLVLLCFASYYLRMFGVTAGYHRYFAHRTYKLNRFWQFCMAFLAETSAQKGVLWWAGHHRHHHKFSDQGEDLHSPKQDGFWCAHVGWFLAKEHHATDENAIRDFAKYPELRLLDKHYIMPAIIYAALFLLIGGLPALVWGFFVSTVLCWHGTFTINSLSHVFGSQRYKSNDTSRNNFLLAIVTMGEGWHNNHHTYMTSTNQGFYWWEWDPTYYILKVLSWVGITHDLRRAPVELLDGKRIVPEAALIHTLENT